MCSLPRPLRKPTCRYLAVLMSLCWTQTCAESIAKADEPGWIKFERCPVLVERTVEVPAIEQGIVKSIAVELNQEIAAGEIVAELDTELAHMELEAAQLEYSIAAELAKDESTIEYRRFALEQAEHELANYRAISSSVSESEIRRLKLAVDLAKLELIRSEKSKKAAESQALVRRAAVEVAKLRLKRRQVMTQQSGIVTKLKVSLGQSVEAGQPLMEIRNLEYLLVDRLISIHDFDLTKLVGAAVRVEVPLADGSITRLAGKVTSYDPEVSSQGLVRMHARVQNIQRDSHWVLLPGREVTMYLEPTFLSTATRSQFNFQR